MTDIVSPEKRSLMMAGIKGKNTKPELIIRKALHRAGFRFKLHDKRLPGKPDLVFPRYHAVLFVHGCFWHRHDCHLFKWPSSKVEFWKEKIMRNHQVDLNTKTALTNAGWRVGIIWECSLKGKGKLDIMNILQHTTTWLASNEKYLEIRGKI